MVEARQYIDRLRLRLFRRVSNWSITLDGTITWWSRDDIHFRERKVDKEYQLRGIFRPLCWIAKHSEYYGYCVYCEKVRPRGQIRGWKQY
jgi:hypothetical protein